MLGINFFNLTSLYLRHSTTPRLVHIPVVSGPLAWTFIALFWDGAAMVGAHSLPARILANVAIWSILVYGTLFLVAFKDYTIGFELTILSACKCFLYLVCIVLWACPPSFELAPYSDDSLRIYPSHCPTIMGMIY